MKNPRWIKIVALLLALSFIEPRLAFADAKEDAAQAAKDIDAAYKEAAYRSYNWVTYFQGLPGNAHAPFTNQWWFTDQFSDGPRRMMDAFWAVPEWAPGDESHLLGSISPVTKISYGAGSVTYSTFDAASTDVLRLDFVPDAVMADGRPLRELPELSAPGYSFDRSTRVLRIRHDEARNIDIRGKSGRIVPAIVTFDDPHLPASTALDGGYPTPLLDWGNGVWKISPPAGKFGTFHLVLAGPKWLIDLGGSILVGTLVYGLLLVAVGLKPAERRAVFDVGRRLVGRA